MGVRQTNQKKYLSYSIDLFQGGMDSDASPYTLREGMAALSENVVFYRDGTIRSRKGYLLTNASPKTGMFVTHRLNGSVNTVYRNGGELKVGSAVVGALPDEPHHFLRTQEKLLIVQPSGVLTYDGHALYASAVPKPAPLTFTQTAGTGTLKVGTYNYQYHFLLTGGGQSEASEEQAVAVTAENSAVTLTIPTPPASPLYYKLRIYRRGPDDGYPLMIAELNPDETVLVDNGLKQSALIPLPGITAVDGGNLATIHNRRLFVVNGDTLQYSYQGDYGYRNVFWTERVVLPTGEKIRAIAPLGQGLVFFGLETALFMNDVPSNGGGFTPLSVADGCINQNAWTLAEDNTLFYVGRTGVYAMNNAASHRISDAVGNYFRDLNPEQLENITVNYDPQDRKLVVTLPDTVLVFSMLNQGWTTWTIPGLQVDLFEGRFTIYTAGSFGVLGEHDSDNGQPIQGRFTTGLHAVDDPVTHKLFRRVGIQVSASANDEVDLNIKTYHTPSTFTGLDDRDTLGGAIWGVSIWGADYWAGNADTLQTVSLPDHVQGRYIQLSVSFTTHAPESFVLMGPLVVEYRSQYRYGRN